MATTTPLVMSQTNGHGPAIGGLFAGIAFFLVQRLPLRSTYIDKIQANGGRVVKLEQQADHIVADHVRKDCPPGSISYTFIDAAITNAQLPDPDQHRAGPIVGAVREVGSGFPGKQTKTPFTGEDDRVLWQWVERAKAQGGRVKGNEIYKQLEEVNSRHTFQAWRDRYIKKLMDRPPPAMQVRVPANPPPSPPTAPDEEPIAQTPRAKKGKKRKAKAIETRRAARQSKEIGEMADEELVNGNINALETQDILNTETQIPDLGVPLPPDTDSESDDSLHELQASLLRHPPAPTHQLERDSRHHHPHLPRRLHNHPPPPPLRPGIHRHLRPQSDVSPPGARRTRRPRAESRTRTPGRRTRCLVRGGR
ncbi:hypothetical protein BAUCODRAFT_571495 [Baudoinia panamericana UAMH 10762]|uniref:DNA-binding protein RAP1 n=1 Tax=Baudoinia panamericana (strain UAMH 10762) TaxID=717646 RepID=M2LXM5_BAUPA|nr:uncharacterized protein BAUCODRAFT_571495 [Baudoinia panamericana UAMH 10762]EMC99442.1 hypothetical protein BAUCODRAFT_571495 [Baudoinia panamericana UAMH 10762]